MILVGQSSSEDLVVPEIRQCPRDIAGGIDVPTQSKHTEQAQPHDWPRRQEIPPRATLEQKKDKHRARRNKSGRAFRQESQSKGRAHQDLPHNQPARARFDAFPETKKRRRRPESQGSVRRNHIACRKGNHHRAIDCRAKQPITLAAERFS